MVPNRLQSPKGLIFFISSGTTPGSESRHIQCNRMNNEVPQMIVLKGHDFSRAIKIARIDAGFSPCGTVPLSVVNPENPTSGAKAPRYSSASSGTAEAVPFQNTTFTTCC
jgi:hypothetical protein